MANQEELSKQERIYVALTIIGFVIILCIGLYQAMVIPAPPGQEAMFSPFPYLHWGE